VPEPHAFSLLTGLPDIVHPLHFILSLIYMNFGAKEVIEKNLECEVVSAVMKRTFWITVVSVPIALICLLIATLVLVLAISRSIPAGSEEDLSDSLDRSEHDFDSDTSV